MTSKTDFTLYYWSVPFRGQFIRAILAYAGQTVEEPDDHAIGKIMGQPPAGQPYPFMGPPVLVDHADGSTLAQMPAIALYLGEKLRLLPAAPIERARALKVVLDCNDVIDELTLQGGVYRMWDDKLWKEFVPRLERWMAIFEATGERHGLQQDSGFLLGGLGPSLADIVTATLWGTMGKALPVTATMLDKQAPKVAALTRRINAMPSLSALAEATARRFGDQYCGGEIEKSLRAVAR